jgi:hypothetical protein
MSTLAGALLTRFGWWAAGQTSAADPRPPLQLGESTVAGALQSGGAKASDDRGFEMDRRSSVPDLRK